MLFYRLIVNVKMYFVYEFALRLTSKNNYTRASLMDAATLDYHI